MKPLIKFFALFYLVSSIGYGVEVHYCLGRVSDVSYALFDTNCPCDEAGIDHGMSCCDEKSFFNQLDEEHQSVAGNDFKIGPSVAYTLLPYQTVPSPQLLAAEDRVVEERGPPIVRNITIELVRLITYG